MCTRTYYKFIITLLIIYADKSKSNVLIESHLKGIVHLNIIFSYMKVNKIRNLDHPVY